MRAWVAAALLLTASTAYAQDSLKFWYDGVAPAAVIPALECAAERWRAATCLPIDVSLDALHIVRWTPAAYMGGRSGWTTGSTWEASTTKLLDSLTPAQACPVLMHEMSHILRQSNDHPAPDGSFAALAVHVVSLPHSHITPEDLALVCSKQPCGCFHPEE